jgi:hypothetical protein
MQQTELEDTANQLRNLRLYIQQMRAARDREEEEAGAPAERAPTGRAPAEPAPTGSAPAEPATAAANEGSACAGIVGPCPGHQWRTVGAAPAARIYQGASGPERGAAVAATGLDPAERAPIWRDGAPSTAESTPARLSLGGGAARGSAPYRRLAGGEKLRSRIDDDDEQWALSRDDTQPRGRLAPGMRPASEVPSSVRWRTGSISHTPAVPQGCVISESSLRRGKHATTARFLQV